MSSVIHDFDLQARGAVVIIDHWKSQEADVRAAWPLADVLACCEEMFSRAFSQFDEYCNNGSFSDPNVRFSYFAQLLRELVLASDVVVGIAATEFGGHPGLATLKSAIDRAQAILDEDSFATDMAMISLKESD